jgi:uncharacterized protein (TIGR02268 family)
VSVPPCRVVSLWLLLLPASALAQPESLDMAAAARQIELSQTPSPELWVAPGQTTWVTLDAPLDVSTMRQAPRVEGLRRVEVLERAVALVPGAGVKAGAQLDFTLWFADGQPAEGVRLVLKVDSAKGEPEVEVYRGEIPPAALKRQVDAWKAQVAALTAREASLSAVVAAGLVGPAGIRTLDMSDRVQLLAPGLTSGAAWLHIAAGRMALEVTLTLAPGAAAWAPDTVTLTEMIHGTPLPVRSVRLVGGAALQPGNTTRLLVEWDVPPAAVGLEYDLKAAEQSGERGVTVKRIIMAIPTQPAGGAKPKEAKKP